MTKRLISDQLRLLLCLQEGGQVMMLEREEIQRVVSSCNDFAEAEKRSKCVCVCVYLNSSTFNRN